MPSIPETFWNAFEQRNGPCILGTTDPDGTPNTIYVGVLKRAGNNIEIADSAFSKTRDNLLAGSKASFLFITDKGIAHQAKCTVDYRNDETSLARAKNWASSMYEPKAIACLRIESIFCGAQKIA